MRPKRLFAYVPEKSIARAPDKARAFVPRLWPKTWRSFARAVLMAEGMRPKDIDKIFDKGPLKKTRTIDAFINFGRWVALCECGGAEVVDPDDPLFLCLSCMNEEDKGRMRPVLFPGDVREVERKALKGKEMKQRNWRPGDGI